MRTTTSSTARDTIPDFYVNALSTNIRSGKNLRPHYHQYQLRATSLWNLRRIENCLQTYLLLQFARSGTDKILFST